MSEAAAEGLSPRQSLTERLVNSSLDEVDRRYGANAEYPLAYHNRIHGGDVVDAATSIAYELEAHRQVSIDEIDLLRLAAAGHDLVLGVPDSESKSAELVIEAMRRSQFYSEEEIAKVRTMILATKVSFVDGKMLQSAADGDLLAKILCDADLSILGRPQSIFWPRALDLKREKLGKKDLTAAEVLELVEEEIDVLENHEFYTATAKQMFPYRAGNIHWLKTQL